MKTITHLWRLSVRHFNRLPEWMRLSLVGLVALAFFIFGGAITWATFMPIPAINNFESRQVAESTKIYDRTGNIVLYDVHGSVRRTYVPLEAISPNIQKATIAIEDDEFYSHHGFRPISFMRAVLADLLTGSFEQGGSTITQQVVKNALLTKKKTITRKLQEIILALRLERVYSKDQILNTYLNENPYGGTIYGVEEASQYFFGTDAKNVDIAEAAYLAALPQAPTYYSPYGNHRDELDRRKDLVLSLMRTFDMITEEEYETAKAEQVQFKDEAEAGIKAPHFVFFVREYLEEKYGVDAVQKEGLKVTTTLDYDLQKKAEETVTKFAPGMQANFDASNEGIVAVEPSTGQILAMVGSRGYFDDTIDGKVNVTTSHRQPGSSFKPIVYATAFEKGYTPDTIVFDLKTQFSTACAPSNFSDEPPCYSPENFDLKFKGPVKLRDALAQSINIPSIKLLYLTGIEDSITTARNLGITTLADASRYGLTLVLGGGEVTLLEMTGAYSVFGNDGMKNAPTGILRVEDRHGNVLEEYTPNPSRVLEPQIARQVNDVLSDNEARAPEFGANSPLYFPGYNVADKTGTTNDFHDVWIIGYTPAIAVGAWAGNNDNSAMQRKIAAFIIAPMWHDFMEYALEKYPAATSFVPPAPEADYDSLPPVLRGTWNTDATRGVHEILYWVRKDNPHERQTGNPYADSQFPYWDYAVQLWAGQQPVPAAPGEGGEGTGLRILTPQHGALVYFGQAINISAYYPYPERISQVSYFLNGASIGSSSQPPYAITFAPNARGVATIQAAAQGSAGTETSQITVTIQ
ncbi:PBP1A family penicillin-binding protein [Candidatus Kaiserbacteria bacterium]|nr:PBP1A family penicillin-binding protein [Candidatus Kaiserbacteria bacterium]